MKLASLVIAFAPAVCFALSASWHRRRQDRMAPVTIVLGSLWGAFVATSLTLAAGRYAESMLMLPLSYGTWSVGSVVLTPMVEEALKTVFLVMLLFRARLETALEGAMIGCAVGLGFAATENFLAFAAAFRELGGGGWLSSIAFRTGVTGMMHAAAAATAGALIGMRAGGSQLGRWIVGPLGGHLAATLIHTGFNGGVQVAAAVAPAAGRVLQALLALLVLVILFAVARHASRSESARVREALEREVTARRVPQGVLGRFDAARAGGGGGAAWRLGLLLLREAHVASRPDSDRRRELESLRESLREGA